MLGCSAWTRITINAWYIPRGCKQYNWLYQRQRHPCKPIQTCPGTVSSHQLCEHSLFRAMGRLGISKGLSMQFGPILRTTSYRHQTMVVSSVGTTRTFHLRIVSLLHIILSRDMDPHICRDWSDISELELLLELPAHSLLLHCNKADWLTLFMSSTPRTPPSADPYATFVASGTPWVECNG